MRRVAAILMVLLVLASVRTARAQLGSEDADSCGPGAACPLDDTTGAVSAGGVVDAAASVTLVFFWGVGCPHCEEAKPFLASLAKEDPRLRIEAVEVRKDPEGRRRFLETMKRLGATAIGVPTFVVSEAYVVGYVREETDRQVRAVVTRALRPAGADAGATAASRSVNVPVIGEVDPVSVSLPAVTIAIGLVDGVNPCAIWVLVVLLGILLHVKTTSHILLYAGAFIAMSGVVYFLFMTVWSALFELVGLSRVATMILGGALLAMGIVNLKEIVWFKKGPSLVIPDKLKPGLFRRMRAIASAGTAPTALGGILALAFVVNLVELGCTVGLPAVYTRILSLRALGSAVRLGYLALYNLAYVVPLIAVVAAFIVLRQRLAMTERAARILKGLSGLLLTAFGTLFLVAPEMLLAM